MSKRVLLKVSGEAFRGGNGANVDPSAVGRLIGEVASLEARGNKGSRRLACELAVVVGGGNFFRGSIQGEELGMDRIPADYAGMVATIVNGIILTEVLERRGFDARHMSAIEAHRVAEPYIYRRAIRHLEKGRTVVLTAGTGNPRSTTDTAMVLRGIELKADMILKGTKVEGVYDKDPAKHKDAQFVPEISYSEFLQKNLGILDATAVSSARADGVSIRVFDLFEAGNLKRIVEGEHIGSLIGANVERNR